mmetsp:Transcript_100825/g.284378  ORF Transcript_100825/g.284378 Transcript_100825/m.284378 type:complete len:377 (-) Transcript_100825:1194-2324(-)
MPPVFRATPPAARRTLGLTGCAAGCLGGAAPCFGAFGTVGASLGAAAPLGAVAPLAAPLGAAVPLGAAFGNFMPSTSKTALTSSNSDASLSTSATPSQQSATMELPSLSSKATSSCTSRSSPSSTSKGPDFENAFARFATSALSFRSSRACLAIFSRTIAIFSCLSLLSALFADFFLNSLSSFLLFASISAFIFASSSAFCFLSSSRCFFRVSDPGGPNPKLSRKSAYAFGRKESRLLRVMRNSLMSARRLTCSTTSWSRCPLAGSGKVPRITKPPSSSAFRKAGPNFSESSSILPTSSQTQRCGFFRRSSTSFCRGSCQPSGKRWRFDASTIASTFSEGMNIRHQSSLSFSAALPSSPVTLSSSSSSSSSCSGSR